jgi:hypothetical protein
VSTFANGRIQPVATEEETAAIVAALEALWPRPAVVVAPPSPQPSAWRFSGRWWARPLPLRRERPYF